MSKANRGSKAKTGSRANGRQRAIELVRRRIVSGGRPRLLVSFLLALTGASGFLVSTALLHLGVTMMTVRYPLAVLSAYSVFLLLLRLWLAFQRKTHRLDDWVPDLGDAAAQFLDVAARTPVNTADAATFGGGANFGGGGAGGAWTGGGGASSSSFDSGGSSSIMDSVPDVGLDLDLDLGEGCFWIVIPIIAIAGVLVVMFYVVYVAPIFLAEILVDALLVAGLYKRLKGIEEPRHWLRSVVRRTLLPVMLATALFTAAGYLMGRIAPAAQSIGGFWREINTPKDRL
ncbi:MAG TPA: hypothetical protein VGB76_15575 [Pyrinomonadaceae bacterium]|jgi:hypothetical protein